MRRLVVIALLALAAPAAAHGQADERSLLMPGVTYTRQVEFTPHGPVVMHVVNGPRPVGLYALKPVLSNDLVIGRETLTSMEKRVASSATVVGVSGDLFNIREGYPSGVLMRNGILDTPPSASRSSTAIQADGTLRVERVLYAGYWKGTGQRRPLNLNDPPGANGVTLYTRTWGGATPGFADTTELVIAPFPDARPNTFLTGPVVEVKRGGNTPIPPNGAVLAARGTGAQAIAAEAPAGTSLEVRLTFDVDWSAVTDAIGGGPVLVRGGRPVFRANEAFTTGQLSPRTARAAVGQRADGRIVLVAVDGHRAGYSVGVSNLELALAMMRLGCVTASALAPGSSTAMAFDGDLVNRPAPGGEVAIADALLLQYVGVYAAPPGERVLSPNGDAVAERQTLAYKLVRPSTVAATLTGPDGVARTVDTGARPVGTYRFTWAGTRADGTPEPEGQWRFTVVATDDAGRESSADRTFGLNGTLSNLTLSTTSAVIRRSGAAVRATVTLSRPAKVTATVETPRGVVVRRVARVDLPAGTRSFSWNGRRTGGTLAYGGRYVFRITATNEVGTVDLAKPFSARR